MTDYLIFARRTYQEPLELLGPLRVEGEEEGDQTRLIEQTCGQFGKDGWIEMIAIPESSMARVIPVANS